MFVSAVVPVVALMMSIAAQAAEPLRRELDVGWQMRLVDVAASPHAALPAAASWQSASVPGNVHIDLLANRLIDDPYVGTNEATLQWIGLADWEYRTMFDVDSATLRRAHADLVFDGLDTFADIYLGERKIASTDNMFRTWRIPVQGLLRAHGNVLRVVLHSPIARLLPQVQAMPYKLAGNYPSPYGDEPKDAMTANFARKSGYHYGWDWGPRYVTAGIYKPVHLESWDALRVADFHVAQDKVDREAAKVTVQVLIDATQDGNAVLKLNYGEVGSAALQTLQKNVSLKRGSNRVDLPLSIVRPRLWFPAGYGDQGLYTFSLVVSDANGVQGQISRRTGLRTVELRHDRDAKGRGFAFVVNGVPVFAKGANVIPFDMFYARVTREQQRRVLQSAREANMNLLRNWGGGYYETDAFYDLADELGLMVWQDFMFGGGMPPAYDPAFRTNTVAEARDQLRRLRDHPSLVLWCGNNEEETAWKDWGNGKALSEADPAFAAQAWAGYQQLFGKELRSVVEEEGGGVPYWSSTPSNDLDGASNDTDNGDKHYWDVWAGPAKPALEYLDETPRFMSEYGLQAWPELRTIAAFAKPDEMQIDAQVIRAHQKFLAGEGNTRLLKYIRDEYGEPKNFADFVYLSQVMQAEGIELAALHHRASRPRTMGSLYWQLNDVWPGASWSSIDYYGRWKALQFHARRFYADVAVAALRKDGRTRVDLLNDHQQSIKAELRLRLLDFDGKLVREERRPVELAAAAATASGEFADAELLRGADPRHTLAAFDLWVDGAMVARRVVYFDRAKALVLPDPDLHSELAKDDEGVRLVVSTRQLARELWIDFGKLDVDVADNALTLLPGETLSLRVKTTASLDELRQNLRLRTLAAAAHR